MDLLPLAIQVSSVSLRSVPFPTQAQIACLPPLACQAGCLPLASYFCSHSTVIQKENVTVRKKTSAQ
jgi:hypothetical protein